MKTVYRVLLFVLFGFMIYPSICLRAQESADKKAYSDSLYNVLQYSKTPQEKIVVLRQLADLYWQQPEEVQYMTKIIELANEVDSIHYVYGEVTNLCRYYFNSSNLDSLIYWRNQLDSICTSQGKSRDELYAVKGLVAKLYLEQKNYELAMDDVIRTQNEARKEQHPYGLMTSSEVLGVIYQTIGRDSDAMIPFREGLVWLDKIQVPPAFQMVYFTEMIISALRSQSLDEAERLIKRYENIYLEGEDEKSKKDSEPIPWHKWLINAFYAELYVRRGQVNEAHPYMEKATFYANQSDDEIMKYSFYRAQILYFKALNENEKALDALNRALKVEESPNLLKMKVDLLREMGFTSEAISVYEELLDLNTKINKEAFNRQIQQISTLNDLNGKEKQVQELKYQTEQLALKQHLLFAVIFISVILLVLLYVLNIYYQRTRHLKDDLLREKESLVESEKKLRIAKEHAELANQMKTAFIANISHEVRTPLNAIVGFSELLAENVLSEEEKNEFTTTINLNSELLLNLVNDVLDLSRLESGNVKFKYAPVDIIAFCRNLMDEMQTRVTPDVKVVFTSLFESYTLNTDIYRVQQLLTNLILNAIKFTKRGEIKLTFSVDNTQQEAVFSVADTGCGIPLEKHRQIFDRFEKLDDFVQGTGLGLPICKMVADKFGGRIFIDSSYTTGARFVFIHPLMPVS